MAKRLIPSLNRFFVEKIVLPSITNAGTLFPKKTSKLNSGKVVVVDPGARDRDGKLIPEKRDVGGDESGRLLRPRLSTMTNQLQNGGCMNQMLRGWNSSREIKGIGSGPELGCTPTEEISTEGGEEEFADTFAVIRKQQQESEKQKGSLAPRGGIRLAHWRGVAWGPKP
ncbi:hypothetical protein NE237_024654 [Protea cynaroides]|uniref:Uncharacterized protein n=1 Tax=Protea cynaroides TaxID=273540 RepID=A0A9Q0K101_9MAGN|nr:hypothetical protein NE237_024654 [Protea cynaroides]